MPNSRTSVWMLATSPKGKGGIATVIKQYFEGGLLDSQAIHFEATHHDRGFAGRIVPFLATARKLWPALFMRRVSLVHAHSSFGGSFWRKLILVLPALSSGVPVVIHLHGSKFMEFFSEGNDWRRHWVRFLFRRSFRVIALSDEWRDWVLRVEPKARVEVVFNSLAAATGLTADTALGQCPSVLFLGRIGERKGTFDLLRAFAVARSRIPDARLFVGGDGDVQQLQAEIKSLGLSDSARYVGWVGVEEKTRLLRDAWVFALPSYQEGLPMAILEAMASSRAVLSCPVGGIPQAVAHGETGLLVGAGDLAGLSDGLITLLSDSANTALLGQAGRRAFDLKFSNDANWPKLLAIYQAAGVVICK